jgi:hypothetical protein
LLTFEVTPSLPTTVGSADAHRRKRQRSRGPTHHVRQAEVNFLANKEHPLEAARPGDHFLSERPEK